MDHRDLAALVAAFDRYRLLCAVRESACGVEGLNRHLSDAFRRRLAHPDDRIDRSVWYPGRPVLVLRNDSTLRFVQWRRRLCAGGRSRRTAGLFSFPGRALSGDSSGATARARDLLCDDSAQIARLGIRRGCVGVSNQASPGVDARIDLHGDHARTTQGRIGRKRGSPQSSSQLSDATRLGSDGPVAGASGTDPADSGGCCRTHFPPQGKPLIACHPGIDTSRLSGVRANLAKRFPPCTCQGDCRSGCTGADITSCHPYRRRPASAFPS